MSDYVVTAAQRVFAIPELVGEILSWLVHSYDPGPPETKSEDTPNGSKSNTVTHRTLLRCACVNSLWFREATRHLWEHPTPEAHTSIAAYLANVSPPRRQMYADFIASGNLLIGPWNNLSETNSDVLDGLSFPRLHTLTLYLYVGLQTILLPDVQTPSLSAIKIELIMAGPAAKLPYAELVWLPRVLSDDMAMALVELLDVSLTRDPFTLLADAYTISDILESICGHRQASAGNHCAGIQRNSGNALQQISSSGRSESTLP